MKRWVCALLCCLVLSGCAPQLNERLIIRAVGVDRTENGFLVTVRTARDSEKEVSYTAEGSTVAAALEKLAQNTGKKPLYSHNEAVIFGRSCAENDLRGAVDFFLRHYDSRPTVKVFLAENTARAVLEIEKGADDYVGAEDIAARIKAEKYYGTTVDADLTALINGVYGANQSAVLPIINKADEIELCGAGVIRDMRLSAVMNADAVRGYLLLCGKYRAGETVLYTETCGDVSIHADQSRCTIRFTGTEAEPVFSVEVEVTGDISSLSAEDQNPDSTAFSELERAYGTVLLQNMNAYLEDVVFKSGCDAAGFGAVLLRESPTIRKEMLDNMLAFFEKSTVELRVTAKINRVEEEDKPYF